MVFGCITLRVPELLNRDYLMSEEIEIIRCVVAGDVDSFRELVERYQGPVLSMIGNIVGDRHMCEDVDQSALKIADVFGDFARLTVAKYCCFVPGDNRNLSHDSRQFGSIPLTSVRGRFGYLYFPSRDWSRFGRVK